MTTIDALVFAPQTAVPILPVATVMHDFAPTGWPGDCSVWIFTAADNEGSRITGLVSGQLPVGTTRWVHNISRRVDAGVLVLRHEDTGSYADNRFVCPGRRDYLVPSGGAVAVRLLDTVNPDTQESERRWHVLNTGTRHMHVVTHGLGLYPALLMAPISGVVDSWTPTVVNADGHTYPSGLGLAGVSLRSEDAAKWTLQTVGASGATIKGLRWTTSNSMDPAWQGCVHWLYNAGPGPITFEHLASAHPLHVMRLPGGRSYVMPVGARWSIHSERQGGWSVAPNGEQPHVVATSIDVSRLSMPVNTDLGALALTGGQTYASLNPTGCAVDVNGNGQPLCGGARITVASGTATIESMVGPGAGKWRNGEFWIRNFGPGSLLIKTGVGPAGHRFKLPSDITIGAFDARRFAYDMTGQWMLAA